MGRRTKIDAEPGRQDLMITREFDLPVELLFKAYEDPGIVEQWMGTKVLKLECKKHGSWQFETRDSQGNIVFRANGAIHEFIPNAKIIRTFAMENAPFGVQLEFLDFVRLTNDTSKLTIQILYRSAEARDQMLQIGMAQGMNMAHNRLQNAANKLR